MRPPVAWRRGRRRRRSSRRGRRRGQAEAGDTRRGRRRVGQDVDQWQGGVLPSEVARQAVSAGAGLTAVLLALLIGIPLAGATGSAATVALGAVIAVLLYFVPAVH